MIRLLRVSLVLVLASTVVAVLPGEGDATVPGAVGRVVFLSNRDHAFGEVYVRDFDGNTATRLTNNNEEESSPKWSPDGALIAFSRNFGTEMAPVVDVFVMNADGSNEVNLTHDASYNDYVQDWSPDGTWILFRSNRGGNFDLWLMRPDGSDARQITDTTTTEYGAEWSPDGSTIAYCAGDFETHIWLMDADGSNARRLDATKDGCDPTWAPDGSRIAYESFSTGNVGIWVVDSDGSNPVDLTNDPTEYYHHAAWSPDGAWIAFKSLGTDWDLMMIHPDGTGLQNLTNSPTTLEWDVDWESVNRLPVAIDDTDAFVHRGHEVEVNVLGNDTDPDGERLVVADITRMPSEGTVVINPSGTVTYAHDGSVAAPGHAIPYTDSFDYKVEDSRLGSAIGTAHVEIYPYFDDVPLDHLFFDDVLWLATQRITYGCNPPDNTLFCPLEPVTRGQMAAFLVRARGYTSGAGADLFIDDNGSVFELDIDRLGTAGVTRGCNPPLNDRFCPDGLVTRGQMAAFLVRAFGLPDLGMPDLFVDDNDSIFQADIDKLGATGVSRGCNPPVNDRFCPDDPVTRQQMAAFIHRAVSWGEE